MANINKLKAWVRYDGTGRLVGGGPIIQATKPKDGDWKEIDSLVCCGPNPSIIVTDKKLKAFVRYVKNKVVAGSMVIQAKKPAAGKWKEIPINNCCAPFVGFNLPQFLSRMNSCYTQVTNLVPNIVYFGDGNDDVPTFIQDGCSDMYDDGNMYNTNLTQLYANIINNNGDYSLNIPYTHTQTLDIDSVCDYTNPPIDGIIADGTNYFGPGSTYLTNMYPGMFILASTGVNVSEFSITGDLGSDGFGTNAAYIVTAHPGWTAFIKTNYDEDDSDPSVNHIILINGDVSGATQLYDDTGAYDDHCVQGLTSANKTIITAIVATEATTPALTEEQALAIANKILDVYKDATCKGPLRLLFSDINAVNAIVGNSGNVSDWNTYFDLPAYGSPFTSVTVVGNEVQLFGGSNIVIKESLFNQPDNLGTYLLEVDDQAGSVIELQYNAFGNDNINIGCPNLTSVNFPEIITLGDYCFGACTSLANVNIPKLITANGNCFFSCDSLISLSFPNLITANGSFVNGCNSLTSVSFPILTTVGNNFFASSGTSLTTISLPELTTAGDNLFQSTISLTNISLPKLVSAGSSSFLYCSSLVNITLPKLEIIGGSGFSLCTALTSVSLPLCTNIGNGSFQECYNLTNINLPACVNLGTSCSINSSIFTYITGNTITLTVPSALMTCNSGQPDEDIQILQANNTVTVITT